MKETSAREPGNSHIFKKKDHCDPINRLPRRLLINQAI